MIHLDRAGPRAGRDVASQASGSGYGPRAPELTAFRRPKLRRPRPSVAAEGFGSIAWGEWVWKKYGDLLRMMGKRTTEIGHRNVILTAISPPLVQKS